VESQTCFLKTVINIKIFNKSNQPIAFMVAVGVKQKNKAANASATLILLFLKEKVD
jgi:hypothetical protein